MPRGRVYHVEHVPNVAAGQTRDVAQEPRGHEARLAPRQRLPQPLVHEAGAEVAPHVPPIPKALDDLPRPAAGQAPELRPLVATHERIPVLLFAMGRQAERLARLPAVEGLAHSLLLGARAL